MNNRILLVWLDESWPELKLAAPWALLDDGGRLLEEGCSVPLHWPAAAVCHVVLSGTQSVLHTVAVPKSRAAEREGLLRYALEERFVKDMEQQHLTVISATSEGTTQVCQVLATGRARLRSIVAYFRSIQRPLTHMASDLLLSAAALEPDSWQVRLGPTGGAVIVIDAARCYACDVDVLGYLLAREVDLAAEKGLAPKAILVRAASVSSADAVLPPSLGRVGVSCIQADAFRWWVGVERSPNLLHTEFAPPGGENSLRRRLRVPLVIAGFSLAALVSSNLVGAYTLRLELAGLDARIAEVFELALPGTPAVLPMQQIRQAVDQRAQRDGWLGADDYLSLLHAVTVGSGFPLTQAIRHASYANGGLTLSFHDDVELQMEHLVTRLAFMGYRAQVLPGELPTLFVESGFR